MLKRLVVTRVSMKKYDSYMSGERCSDGFMSGGMEFKVGFKGWLFSVC